jgi:hypothetical protein
MIKKITLFISIIAMALTINACSSDSGSGQTLSFKVNGVQKNFKVVAETNSYLIYVYGSIGNPVAPTESVAFIFGSGNNINSIADFIYTDSEGNNDGDVHTVSKFTINSASHSEGTFSGTIERPDGNVLTITEGKLSVYPKLVD